MTFKEYPDPVNHPDEWVFYENAMIPLLLLGGQLLIVGLLIFNAVSNKFHLSFRGAMLFLPTYFVLLGVLIWYTLAHNL
jgi:Na+-transporting NADH:ubiquinone oxidoreductase subunit NqrD